MRGAKFSDLAGEIITRITGMHAGSDEVAFETESGKRYRLDHAQACCESVCLEEVHGDPADLTGAPVLVADESTNKDNEPAGAESFLWTFYRLQTIRGAVQMRWLGTSNGYYSEGVDFTDVTEAP